MLTVGSNLRMDLFEALVARAGDTELSSAALLLAAATEKIVVLSGPRHRSAARTATALRGTFT